MDFNTGDKIRFIKDAAFGEIGIGSKGVIKKDYGDAVLIKLISVKGSWKSPTFYLSFVGPDAESIEVIGFDKTINSDIDNIMNDLRGEKLAIDQYQDHINSSTDSEVKSKLTEIKGEEEHHAQELNELYAKKSRE